MSFLIQVKNKVGVILVEKRVEQFPFKIGRGSENDLVISDAAVSARHAVLVEREGKLLFFDSESSNGSFLHGKKITEWEVKTNESIFVGELELHFVADSDAQEKTVIRDLSSGPTTNFRKFNFRFNRTRLAMSGLAIFSFAMILFARNPQLLGPSLAMTDPESIQLLKRGIFEVVVDKVEEKNIVYTETAAFDKLPYQQKMDKYISIGTAFSIEKDKFITAAHVLDLRNGMLPTKYYLRDYQGKVYEIDKVLRYSTRIDFAEVTTTEQPPQSLELKVAKSVREGEIVYTVGNAQGEGISVRAGNVASFTPEPVKGLWKFLRFSAPASPGNSGGPLLNSRGEVTGIVTMKNGSENLNFAYPIDQISLATFERAHFFARRGEFESNQRLEEEEEFFLPLPSTFSSLMTAFNEEEFKNTMNRRQRFEEKFGKELFPRHSKVAEFLKDQDFEYLIGEIDIDSSNRWRTYQPKMKDLALSSGRALSVSENSQSLSQFVLRKKPSESIRDLLDNPKEVFDTLLLAVKWGRKLSNSATGILSYGPPQDQEKWKDVYGRVWLTYAWRSHFDRKAHLLNCLPSPDALSCRWDYINAGVERIHRAYHKIDAHRMSFSYMGSWKDWQEFLSDAHLKDVRPEFMSSLQLVQKSNGSAEVIYGSLLKAKVRAKKSFDRSSLGLGFGIDPMSEKEALRPMLVSFRPDDKAAERFSSFLIYKPADEDSVDARVFWKSLLAESEPYNGIVTTDGTKMQSRFVNSDRLNPRIPASGASADTRVYTRCENVVTDRKNEFREACKNFATGVWIR